MTLSDIITEMAARGAIADTTRNGRWANLAYRQIGNAYDWPFTEDSVTGAAGAGTVAVPDMRKMLTVSDISDSTLGRRLDKVTKTELMEDFGVDNVAEAGTPEFWWFSEVGGTKTVNAYPLGGTILARYHKRLTALSSGDEPIFDEEYHNLVVDRAMVEVYKDADEFGPAKEALAQFYTDLSAMARDYMVYTREFSYIQVHDATDG